MTTPTRLPVEEAVTRILASIAPLGAHEVPLAEAQGQVLAEPLYAAHTHPAWRNSAMDGYAVVGADVADATAETPVTLPVAGTIAAGDQAPASIERGTAWRIMTGAPVPDAADSVIRIEDTDRGDVTVRIDGTRDVGRNVRPRGEDFRTGDELIAAGTLLRAPHIGLGAGCGRATLAVHRRPRVAIVGSGNELVDLDAFDEVLAGHRIINTNGYALAAAVREAGGIPIELGIAADDPAAIAERITSAPPFDALITCGGISVGAFDYTRDVVQRLGARLDFWRVRMRPGGPFGFGMLHGVPWFGLPGNPVSALVTFELFVRPALLRMRGHAECVRRPVAVQLPQAVTTQGGLTHFLRCTVHSDDGGAALLTGPQSSGMLTSMAAANALLIVPHDRMTLDAGATARAILLLDDSSMAVSCTY